MHVGNGSPRKALARSANSRCTSSGIESVVMHLKRPFSSGMPTHSHTTVPSACFHTSKSSGTRVCLCAATFFSLLPPLT